MHFISRSYAFAFEVQCFVVCLRVTFLYVPAVMCLIFLVFLMCLTCFACVVCTVCLVWLMFLMYGNAARVRIVSSVPHVPSAVGVSKCPLDVIGRIRRGGYST